MSNQGQGIKGSAAHLYPNLPWLPPPPPNRGFTYEAQAD